MGREMLFSSPFTLVLNLAPFWHNNSCWELREKRWGGAKRKEKSDKVREGRRDGRREKEASCGEKEEVVDRK